MVVKITLLSKINVRESNENLKYAVLQYVEEIKLIRVFYENPQRTFISSTTDAEEENYLRLIFDTLERMCPDVIGGS